MKTTKTTVQTVRGAHGVLQRTDINETTTTDVVPSFWQSMAGSRTPIFLDCGFSLLIAFLLAAVAQRVLLGQYAFSLGPLTVPEITENQLKNVMDSTIRGAGIDIATYAARVEPQWAADTDPNQALSDCRIDIEKEVRQIAGKNGIQSADSEAIETLVTSLSEKKIIAPGAAPGLQNLLDLGDRALRGASVDKSSINVLRTEGRAIVGYLDSLNS